MRFYGSVVNHEDATGISKYLDSIFQKLEVLLIGWGIPEDDSVGQLQNCLGLISFFAQSNGFLEVEKTVNK